jgi:hypothetical protein
VKRQSQRTQALAASAKALRFQSHRMARQCEKALIVFGGLFGQKGRNANAAIGMVQVAHELVALCIQLRVKRGVNTIVEQFFDAG